ncbi:MAG: CdaR family protein [Tissierellia bacterium]|nr:CdaR family protein [Tissierellia bacterium]
MKKTAEKKKINFGVMFASLAIAVFLWSYVIAWENPDRDREYRGIDVVFENLDSLERQGLYLLSPEDAKISVTLRGKTSDFTNHKISGNEHIKASIDLTGYKSGLNRIPVNVSLVENSSDVKIASYEPSTILVNLDKIITERKKIDLIKLGDIPEGYVLGNIQITPEYITLKGPESYLDSIKSVTAILDLEGKTETLATSSKIMILDKNEAEVSNVKKDVDSTDISVQISKIKAVPIEPVYLGKLPEDITIENIEIDPENIIIKGNKNTIDKIVKISTQPIDYQRLMGSETYNLKLDLPEGVSLNSEVEPVLKYKLNQTIVKNIEVPIENLIIKNKSNEFDYKYNFLEEKILVSLEGEADDLEQIEKGGLKLYLEVKGLKEGIYNLTIKIENETNLAIKKIMPEDIEIEISNKDEE